ncbi:MAG: DUF393 domain-containing protein [Verrucomicrobiae bacterium]|nr:DUF393 domain-containing protein [Verrucomicrobiae bacterium]
MKTVSASGPVPAPPDGFPGAASGWVFFDAICPVCIGIVNRWGGLFRRHGYVFVPLQEPWVSPVLGVSSEELRREMKLRRRDGVVIGGIEAWRELGRSLPWIRPLVALAGWPVLRPLADAAYRWIAANRYCLGGVCPGPEGPSRHPMRRSSAALELP